MKKFFFMLALTLAILFIVNISWLIANLYLWSTEGIIAVTGEENDGLFEDIYYSEYARWIIWADLGWIVSLLIFIFRSKHTKLIPIYIIYNLMVFLIQKCVWQYPVIMKNKQSVKL